MSHKEGAATRGVVLLAAGLATAGCFLVRDTVNDSPNLRWWLFSNFGASHVCPEMINRGVPLQLGDEPAAVGRFFPSNCSAQVDDNRKTLALAFGGSGYAWTPLAGRIAFTASTSVSYRPDFAMTEDALYVWSRLDQIIAEPVFSVVSIENPVVNWAAQGPAGYLANQFGRQLLASRMAEGFTVVRTDQGDEFSLGVLKPPQRPQRPFATNGQSVVLFNETVRIRTNQAEFLGPLIVAGDGQVMSLRTRSSGPASEVHLVPRTAADAWRAQLDRGFPLAAPTTAPLNTWVIAQGDQQVAVPIQAGHYFLVFENSGSVGTVAPAWNPFPGMTQGALDISLVVELLERN